MTFAKLPPLSKTLTKCCACHEKTTHLHWRVSKVLRLSRKTRKTSSHFVTWERQNEHFVRDFLHFSYFEGKDCVAVRVYRPMERNYNDAATTTRRRHDQHDANTGSTPDNYKREPFATHPGKKWTCIRHKLNENGTIVLDISTPAPCIGAEAAVHVQHLPAGFTVKHSQILKRRKAALPGSAASFQAATTAPRPQPRSTGTLSPLQKTHCHQGQGKGRKSSCLKMCLPRLCESSQKHKCNNWSDHLNCQSMIVPLAKVTNPLKRPWLRSLIFRAEAHVLMTSSSGFSSGSAAK